MSHTLAPRRTSPPEAITLTDPRTGLTLGAYDSTTPDALDAIVTTARSASSFWAGLTPRQRGEGLNRWADALARDTPRLVREDTRERGVPATQSQAELVEAIDLIRFYATAARTAQAPAAARWMPKVHSRVSYRPLGTVGCILPWNYPLMMLAWRAAPALAAGNAVIVKPAEQTPSATARAVSLAQDSLGDDVLSIVVGGRGAGHLLASARLDGYAFTGSTRAGLHVAQSAAPAPVSLETGGNCPAIFFDDAPLESEDWLIAAAFHNAGQSCAAPSRVITVGPDATSRVLAALSECKPVDTPLISRAALARTLDRIEDAAPSRIVYQVDDPSGPPSGFFIPGQAVLIPPGSQVALRTEETFAPVITIEEVGTEERALGLALDPSCKNDLAASVWTDDLERAHHLAYVMSLHVGEIWINCALEQTAELPHSSGGGTDLSTLALDFYRRPTTVTTRSHR